MLINNKQLKKMTHHFTFEENEGLIDNEIKNLYKIMKQKEMRRYKNFLFSMYNYTKLYVSIREFVWTHINYPYLADITCKPFIDYLKVQESKTNVQVHVTDLCVGYPQLPERFEVQFNLNHTIGYFCECYELSQIVNIEGETIEMNPLGEIPRRPIESIRYKHPEDNTSHKVLIDSNYTFGDLGITNNTRLLLYPSLGHKVEKVKLE